MSIKQLSVFAGNEKGSIADITDVLSEAGVNLRAMTVADAADFGILRLIADDTDKAVATLKEAGIISGITEVTSFTVPDEPGGLSRVLRTLSDNGINSEYMYSLFAGRNGSAQIVIRVSDNAYAEKVLRSAGIEVADDNRY